MRDYLHIIAIILAIITVMMIIDLLFYRIVETEIGTALMCEKINGIVVCVER